MLKDPSHLWHSLHWYLGPIFFKQIYVMIKWKNYHQNKTGLLIVKRSQNEYLTYRIKIPFPVSGFWYGCYFGFLYKYNVCRLSALKSLWNNRTVILVALKLLTAAKYIIITEMCKRRVDPIFFVVAYRQQLYSLWKSSQIFLYFLITIYKYLNLYLLIFWNLWLIFLNSHKTVRILTTGENN